MSIFREIPPTAGYPITAADLIALGRPGTIPLEEAFREYLGVPYSRLVTSGTTALYCILEALKTLSPKRTVVIPSYTCPLVALAIARAGLAIEVCDTNGTDFDLAKDAFEGICSVNGDILAVVATHLGGMVGDMAYLTRLAARYGITVIEDCAQSLGANYAGRSVGTIGDFAFFSLCRGKGVTTYEGGMVVTKHREYAALLDRTIDALCRPDAAAEVIKIIELAGYALCYRPAFFWFVFRAPELFWQWRRDPVRAAGEYSPAAFPVHTVSPLRAAVGSVLFSRLEREISAQRARADYYIEGLRNAPGVRVVREHLATRGTYPFVTLLFDDPLRRDRLLAAGRRRGIGISFLYLYAMTDYHYLGALIPPRPCPAGRAFARRQLTLSTSTFSREREMDAAIDLVRAG